MSNATLKLSLITQERKLLEEQALFVTLPGEEGEFTVLPGHINLFTRIKPGMVTIKTYSGQEEHLIMVSGGFVDVGPTEVKIMADSAVRAEEIDIAVAEQAKKEAVEAMKNKQDKRKFVEAEASLRKALLELETARRWKKLKHLS